MTLCPDFSTEEWMYIQFKPGYIQIDEDAPDDVLKSILEKAGKCDLNTDPSQVRWERLGEGFMEDKEVGL